MIPTLASKSLAGMMLWATDLAYIAETTEAVVDLLENAASASAATKRFILRRSKVVPTRARVLRSLLVKMAAIVEELERPPEGKTAPSDILQVGEIVNE